MSDIGNDQLVGIQGGERIVILNPKITMTKREALVHAAWLVAIADDNDEFSAILEEVNNT